MKYKAVRAMCGAGTEPERFTSALRAICTDARDRLYAAGDREVKVFDADGRLRRRWSTARPGLALAVDAAGSVYVGQDGQIEVFDGAGKPLRTLRAEGLGDVTAIGFVKDQLLAADARDRSIRRYDRDFRLLNVIGKDNRTNGFHIPNGMVDFDVDGQGILHAPNPGKHRVERYTPDGRLLGHIGHFNQLDPAGFPGCCNPTNVAVDVAGNAYVTEKAGPRAKVLDAAGKLVSVIATTPFDPNCKNMRIALDSRGRVYVTDTVRLSILVFEKEAA
jgi:sugar lactone lactonase YvrE